MKSRSMAATAARSTRLGDTWFWWLMAAIGVLACAAMVFQNLFWWFTIFAVALMIAGSMIEVFCDWTRHRALSRQREEQTPKQALSETPSTETAQGEERTLVAELRE